jgi:hypothetical protein
MRGFLGGVSVGALVAVGGVAMVSLSAPLPKAVDVSDVEALQTPVQENEGPAPETSGARDADVVEAAPRTPADDTATGADLPANLDTKSANKPEPETQTPALSESGLAVALNSPNLGDTLTEDTPFNDTPLGGTSQNRLQSLPTPASEAEPAVNTKTATAVSVPDASGIVPDTGSAPSSGAVDAPQVPTLDGGSDINLGNLVALPDAPAPQDSGLGLDEIAPIPSPQISDLQPEKDAILAPAQTPIPVPSASVPGDPSGEDLLIEELPHTAAQADEAAVPSRFGTPVKPLTDRKTAETTQKGVAGLFAQLPPFEANAVPVKLVDGRPYMSIILIEEEGSIGAEALADFPYPLSFAINPDLSDAAERMAARRAAGFEVMVLADLPRTASAQDAETALSVWLSNLPQAMGILEGVNTGVQGNRSLASHVAALARDMGYGLVMQDNGLNTVQKLAHREGVPSGVVFRDFDGAGQDPRAMRRFLDQAAFRAGQEGAVLMLGRLKPDTISALLMWGLQDRASRVALMPTSASLRLLSVR